MVTLTVQSGQRLILGTLQSRLKPPRASADPDVDAADASNADQKTMREVRPMVTIAFPEDTEQAITAEASSAELIIGKEMDLRHLADMASHRRPLSRAKGI